MRHATPRLSLAHPGRVQSSLADGVADALWVRVALARAGSGRAFHDSRHYPPVLADLAVSSEPELLVGR